MRRTTRRTDPPSGSPRTAALRLLGRRDYSAAEITRRLVERGYAREAVEAAVADLEAGGIIDDRRAAEVHVRTASRLKGRGALRIRRELEARGIRAEAIDYALAGLSPDDDRAAIRRFLERKPPPDTPQVRRRLFQQLVRRGFSPALVAAELRIDARELGDRDAPDA